jgi:hypothetical protein
LKKSLNSERRTQSRHQLAVGADITDVKSGVQLKARTNDIGSGGCFVDVLSPLPTGTSVKLRFSRGDIHVEVSGDVIYSQNGLGMGIAFHPMEPGEQRHLDLCIDGFAHPKAPPMPSYTSPGPPQRAASEELVKKVIVLLVNRGVIQEEDGTALLNEMIS